MKTKYSSGSVAKKSPFLRFFMPTVKLNPKITYSVHATTVALGALALTDAMPLSIPEVDEYIYQ